ncbi:MAG TPA: hypothetical protein VEV17_17175 [Bryobacteraceae bacterium]|nr:hypothetical protein [Bryobacteraceae bacterium]
MRDFVLLAAVCVVVVIGVGWFLLPGTPADLFRSRVEVQPQTPDVPLPPPVAAPAPHKVVRTAPVEHRPEVAPPAPAPAPAPPIKPVVATLVPPEPVRVPAPWEVQQGEESSEIVDTYGVPSLSTETQESGHVFETYVYRTGRAQSMVQLQDGKVSLVYLKDSPRLAKP